MPEDDGTPTKKKTRPAAKRSPRKRTVKASSTVAATPMAAAPAPPLAASGDRLAEVARTIGSTVGGIVKKTKRVLRRRPENK